MMRRTRTRPSSSGDAGRLRDGLEREEREAENTSCESSNNIAEIKKPTTDEDGEVGLVAFGKEAANRVLKETKSKVEGMDCQIKNPRNLFFGMVSGGKGDIFLLGLVRNGEEEI